MRTSICVIAATLVAFAGAENAWADADAGQGYLSIMITYMDDDEDRNTEDGVNGGHLGMGYALSENWNVEAFVTAAMVSGNDQDHLALGLDFQRVFRRSEKFSPYVHIGVGYFEIDAAGPSRNEEGSMGLLGAGFYLDMFESNVALRGEYTYRLETATEEDDLVDNLWSLGIHIPFGD